MLLVHFKCILFSRGKCSVKNFAVNTTDGPLTNNNVTKYLGVIFDHKLSWEQHIQYVVAKLCVARGHLTKLWHYVPVTVLRSVFFDIVHSYLQYGATSWGNAASRACERGFRGYIVPGPGLGGPGLKGPGRVQFSALSFGIAP